MRRRQFLLGGLGITFASPIMAALTKLEFDDAGGILEQAVNKGDLDGATLYVRHKHVVFQRAVGSAASMDDIFLLASISKPMSAAAAMTLLDRGEFALDDAAQKFIPELRTDGHNQISIRQLLTHTSGLPDQLPQNASLRARHAGLSEFVAQAVKTPLLFAPGSKYSYSSMGILLLSEIAQRISGQDFPTFVDKVLFQPLGMRRTALGLGRFKMEQTMRCQVTEAAPESGGGDATATSWDWNSRYWRSLGAPWGGAHGSAPDVAAFLAEFLHPTDRALRQTTAKLMIRNQNRSGLHPRGLGFDVGASVGGRGCSDKTFGHSGSTGTLAWVDPASDTICVVLTTLPATAATRHPRKMVSNKIAALVSQANSKSK